MSMLFFKILPLVGHIQQIEYSAKRGGDRGVPLLERQREEEKDTVRNIKRRIEL